MIKEASYDPLNLRKEEKPPVGEGINWTEMARTQFDEPSSDKLFTDKQDLDFSAWGRRLRQARETRRLRQGELARQATAPQPNLHAYESGHKKPTLKHLFKLANMLEVCADHLLGLSRRRGAATAKAGSPRRRPR